MSAEVRDVAEFETIAGLHFNDKRYLQSAFVHRSFMNEIEEETELTDNERLEFLGDAVLGFVTSEMLYRLFPNLSEGELTNLRAALVRRETLARFAGELKVGDFLLLGHGEEDSGGRTRPATLCATFEAVIGAVYIDAGLSAVREFLAPRLEDELERVAVVALAKDPKSRLQEWIQSELGVTPRYKTIVTQGPDHARVFTVQVTADKHPYGIGRGRSKQEAAQSAAAMALHRLGLPALEYTPAPDLEAEHPLPPLNLPQP
ncbi:ribonuclease III [bacterium]|nr:ribonuclease III [bacterium]